MLNGDLIFELLRYLLAAYLLILALAAVLGRGNRILLAYPLVALYSTARVVIEAVTFGRVRLTPIARAQKRQQARRVRTWKFRLSEKRRLKEEEQARTRGEGVDESGGWTTADNDGQEGPPTF